MICMDNRAVFPVSWLNYPDSYLAWIRQFLESGQNPNHQFYSGITVLHDAVSFSSDNIGVIRELIDAGADVNRRTHLGFTPLHCAVAHRKPQIVDALIQSGASVNAKDFLGRTVLHIAVTKWVLHLPPISIQLQPNMFIVDKLLKHEDINCNLVDLNGDTPLILAVKDRQIETVELLLSNNANPNICNNDLETPLHVAFSLSASSIECLLLLRGANIYSVNKKGQTPLDILIESSLYGENEKRVLLVLKIIAFKYTVTSGLRRKIELIPQLSKIFNKYCNEVDQMKGDFISGKVSVHDFIYQCYDENEFKFLLLQIHKPVVERLVKDIYSEYFIEIVHMIPKYSLISILQITACSKKRANAKGKAKDLADLFSILDVIFLFLKHLSRVEVFCLIVALSDVTIAESMQNLRERDFFHNCDLN